ncbi:uncharacterized protein [Apostichopus japonicus]|uniref:uncharacterized protein n=1 Tax=Stichopus japonicus TaxID=307972 RepID=UPI003AB80EC7
MMTSSVRSSIRGIVICSVLLCVYCAPAPGREESTTGHGVISTEVENSIPPSDSFDGVSLLRKTLLKIYEDELQDLISRLTGNLDIIDRAVNGDHGLPNPMLGTQPDIIEKRDEPLVLGRGTNLHLYVLSRKLAQLRYEESMRNIELNEKKFQQYG